MIADRLRRVEDDVEMIEAAEVLKKDPELTDRRRPLRQEAEDVGVERHARHEDDARKRGADRDSEHERGVAAGEGENRFH